MALRVLLFCQKAFDRLSSISEPAHNDKKVKRQSVSIPDAPEDSLAEGVILWSLLLFLVRHAAKSSVAVTESSLKCSGHIYSPIIFRPLRPDVRKLNIKLSFLASINLFIFVRRF